MVSYHFGCVVSRDSGDSEKARVVMFFFCEFSPSSILRAEYRDCACRCGANFRLSWVGDGVARAEDRNAKMAVADGGGVGSSLWLCGAGKR